MYSTDSSQVKYHLLHNTDSKRGFCKQTCRWCENSDQTTAANIETHFEYFNRLNLFYDLSDVFIRKENQQQVLWGWKDFQLDICRAPPTAAAATCRHTWRRRGWGKNSQKVLCEELKDGLRMETKKDTAQSMLSTNLPVT